MIQKLVIEGELTDLNTYINAERRNRFIAAKIKKEETKKVELLCHRMKQFSHIVDIDFLWFSKNKRKDHDNIAFAKKFILDGLVKGEMLQGDGAKHVGNFTDSFFVDKERPRVEVILIER